MSYVIAADEIKKSLPGYTPEHADSFHEVSARLADKAYSRALKGLKENPVILMSGGAASGKSEYVSVYLEGTDSIILDGTLPTFKGASIKIGLALKSNKEVEVHAVLPARLPVSFVAFLNRDRKFPVEHFYRTHSSSRSTLLEIAKQYPDIPIKIIVSTGDPVSGMTFSEQQYGGRDRLVEFLERQQYTEQEIRNLIYHDK